MVIEVKYQKGQLVYGCDIDRQLRRLPCPDCLGTQKWEAKTPAGETLEFSCPRCTGWRHAKVPEVWICQPLIRKLTIGTIRVDTGDNGGNSYMCEETGIGSGRIWSESDLFDSEDAALRAGEVRAALADNSPQNKEQYNAASLAASCTYTSDKIREEESRRRKYQFQAEDAAQVVFDKTLDDAEVRVRLRDILEKV